MSTLSVILLVILGVLVVIVFSSLSSAREKGREARERAEQGGTAQVSGATPTTPTSSGGEQLELLSFSCSEEYGYSKVSGQVKNISDKPMKDVMVVGSWFTTDGTFVKSGDALIEYNPILPGQTSPFETLTTGNPAIAKCKVEFKEFFGGTIRTKRSTQ